MYSSASRVVTNLSQLLMGQNPDASLNDPSEQADALSNTITSSVIGNKSGVATVPDKDGMTLVLGGTATAIGEDTDATGQIAGTVADKGPVSIGYGSSTFEAEASDGDAGALASATSFASAEGADIVLCFDYLETKTEGSDSAAEKSQSLVFAIDFKDWDFAGGPIEWHFSPQPSDDAPKTQAIDGNTAAFTADLEAAGTDTIADVDFSVLTLEDTLSDVSGLGVVGIA